MGGEFPLDNGIMPCNDGMKSFDLESFGQFLGHFIVILGFLTFISTSMLFYYLHFPNMNFFVSNIFS